MGKKISNTEIGRGRKAKGRGLIVEGNEDYLLNRRPGRIPDAMKKIKKYGDSIDHKEVADNNDVLDCMFQQMLPSRTRPA